MAEKVCGTCRWHDVDGFYAYYRMNAQGMGDIGFCRQRPPLPDITRLLHPGTQDALRSEVFVFALWPETTANEWCGAWEALDTDEPSGPCWACGARADLACDTCQHALCWAHTFLRRQATDTHGWDGVDTLCQEHAEAMSGYVIDPPGAQDGDRRQAWAPRGERGRGEA